MGGVELQRAPSHPVHAEADAADQHEHDRDGLDRGAVPVRKARVMGRITARRERAETMGERVERRHAGEPECDRTNHGENGINDADAFRRRRNPRRHAMVLERTRCLGLVELHTADPEHRQQRDREHDDADAAEPLNLLAVEQDRLGQMVEPRDDRGARRREPGGRLEQRVDEPHAVDREHERHAPEQTHRRPHQRDDHEAVAGANHGRLSRERQPKREADRKRDDESQRKVADLAVRVVQRHCNRKQQRRAEQQKQHAESADNDRELHPFGPDSMRGAHCSR